MSGAVIVMTGSMAGEVSMISILRSGYTEYDTSAHRFLVYHCATSMGC